MNAQPQSTRTPYRQYRPNKLATNGVVIAYDVHGSREHEVVIGLQGLAEGRLFWPTSLIETIVAAGYCFIALDNRDIGDSSLCPPRNGNPDPYTLIDMADDAVGVMDALGIRKAHILGYSLGGMIAQWLAITHPQRTESLIALMTTSGDPGLPGPDPASAETLTRLTLPLADGDDGRDRLERLWQHIQGAGFPDQPGEGAAFTELLLTSGFRPAAIARQMTAGLVTEPRLGHLARLECPTCVLQGSDDVFFGAAHGEDLARRIPNAHFELLTGANHALTERLMPTLSARILSHLEGIS